jgi:hypothetical protein
LFYDSFDSQHHVHYLSKFCFHILSRLKLFFLDYKLCLYTFLIRWYLFAQKIGYFVLQIICATIFFRNPSIICITICIRIPSHHLCQKINVKNCTNFHTKFDLILISPNPPLLITIFTSQHAEVDVLPIYNFLNIF